MPEFMRSADRMKVLSADPASVSQGEFWLNTTEGVVKYAKTAVLIEVFTPDSHKHTNITGEGAALDEAASKVGAKTIKEYVDDKAAAGLVMP